METISDDTGVLCPRCPSSSRRYAGARGLNIHIGRMHRSSEQQRADPAPESPRNAELDPGGPLGLESLPKLKSSVRVLKHVPKGARSLAASKLSDLIQECLKVNTKQAWFAVLSFAFSALKIPEQKGNASLTAKVKENITKSCPEFPEQSVSRPYNFYRRVEAKVYEGDLGGAGRLLMSECTVAPSNADTINSMREKHPASSRAHWAFNFPPDHGLTPLTVTTDEVASTLNMFHSSSASGPDGIRPQHLKELVSASAGSNGVRLLESLTQLCNFLLLGSLNTEVCAYLYGASLFGLHKKDGGIRPIAVGSTFRRLVAKLGCRAVRERLAAYLKPHQVGFGTALGCEAAIHATRAFVMDPKNNILTFETLMPDVRLLDESTFMLLGAPIFPSGIPAALDIKNRTLVRVQEHLRNLSAHVALTLYRSCFSSPKLTYVVRTAPTWLFPQKVAALDAIIRSTLELIINVTLDDSRWQQASLPIRHGGLGIRSVQAVSLPAFLASSNGVAALVASMLHINGNCCSVPFQHEAKEAWALKCPGVNAPEKPDSQRAWDDLMCKHVLAELSEPLMGTDVARMKAMSCPESGAWLHALPSPQLGTHLDDDSLRVAVALRLGSKLCEPHRCRCGATVDEYAYHGLSCVKSAGRFPRHHALNEIIRKALVSANVPCVLEPPGLSRTDGKRPDGLTLIPWERGRCLLWDATCVSTFAASHSAHTMRQAGAAAEQAARLKRSKYAELEGQYIFVPLAVETSGTWCEEAKRFVGELGRRMRERGGDPRSGAYLRQHISLAIQRGNAASIMGTFETGTLLGGIFD